MNVCMFKGWVQDVPELKFIQPDKKVCEFDIAVPRRYKSQDGKRGYDYIRIVAWGPHAEYCVRRLAKNAEVAVSGELRIDRYKGADGANKWRIYVRADSVECCGAHASGDGAQEAAIGGRVAAQFAPSGSAPAYAQDGYTECQCAPGSYEDVTDDGDLPF